MTWTCKLKKKCICVRKRLISSAIKAVKAINVSAIFRTNLSKITKVTSEEVIFHIPWKPYCLTQHVEISFNKPPIKRSSDLFWLWTNTSYLLDLHATSHDTAPPRNLKLTVSETAAKGSSCTLDFAAKFKPCFPNFSYISHINQTSRFINGSL